MNRKLVTQAFEDRQAWVAQFGRIFGTIVDVGAGMGVPDPSSIALGGLYWRIADEPNFAWIGIKLGQAGVADPKPWPGTLRAGVQFSLTHFRSAHPQVVDTSRSGGLYSSHLYDLTDEVLVRDAAQEFFTRLLKQTRGATPGLEETTDLLQHLRQRPTELSVLNLILREGRLTLADFADAGWDEYGFGSAAPALSALVLKGHLLPLISATADDKPIYYLTNRGRAVGELNLKDGETAKDSTNARGGTDQVDDPKLPV